MTGLAAPRNCRFELQDRDEAFVLGGRPVVPFAGETPATPIKGEMPGGPVAPPRWRRSQLGRNGARPSLGLGNVLPRTRGGVLEYAEL